MEKVATSAEESGTFLFGRNGAMLRKIVDRAAIGMAVTGMDGAVVYTNHAFEREFFLDRSGSTSILDGLFDPQDADAALALSDVLAGRRESYDGEHLCRDHNGQFIWALVAVSVLKSESTDDPMYMIIQVGSIDHRKHMENALAGEAGISRLRQLDRAFGITTTEQSVCSIPLCGARCAAFPTMRKSMTISRPGWSVFIMMIANASGLTSRARIRARMAMTSSSIVNAIATVTTYGY